MMPTLRIGPRSLDPDSMSPAVRSQLAALIGLPMPAPLAIPDPSPAPRRPAQPNKTEARYRREVLDRRADLRAVFFEGLSFRLANGHRYTPDFTAIRADGTLECHEVKGPYAHASRQRSRLAFDQAALEWPCIVWVWAVWSGARWLVTHRPKETPANA